MQNQTNEIHDDSLPAHIHQINICIFVTKGNYCNYIIDYGLDNKGKAIIFMFHFIFKNLTNITNSNMLCMK